MKELFKGFGVVAIVIAFLGLIAAAIWGINVAISGARGQGDALAQHNSSANWVAAQARFEDLYSEIEQADLKVADAHVRMEREPENRTAEDNYYGTQAYCRSVIADYNAEARKYLAEDFRSVDLPERISNTDPNTDCQE